MDNETFASVTRDASTGEPLPEGFIPSRYDATRGAVFYGRGVPGAVWHVLDVRYDQCVGAAASLSEGVRIGLS